MGLSFIIYERFDLAHFLVKRLGRKTRLCCTTQANILLSRHCIPLSFVNDISSKLSLCRGFPSGGILSYDALLLRVGPSINRTYSEPAMRLVNYTFNPFSTHCYNVRIFAVFHAVLHFLLDTASFQTSPSLCTALDVSSLCLYQSFRII
jgi:hypothetical protein